MTWDGFLGEVYCKRCGKRLQGRDEGRPAESYAGTYTGLCYDCERAPVIVLWVYPLDGCKLKEYAPDSPSWRRERQSYHAYDDCTKCKGTGRTFVSRSLSQGGSYYCYCKNCFHRFYDQPRRRAYSDEHSALVGLHFRMGYNDRYVREMCKVYGYKPHRRTIGGITYKYASFSRPDGSPAKELNEVEKKVGERYVDAYDQERKAIEFCIDNRYPDVVADQYKRK